MTRRSTPNPERNSLDEIAELVWKWALRLMGAIGFAYLLIVDPDVPGYFYALLGGLLGLPSVIEYQIRVNRERGGRSHRGGRRD